MTAPSARAPRLAILSYSSGEYDARSLRLARSAIAAGYEVTLYCRWHPGLAPVEERDGFRLIRADPNWRLAVPFLRRGARRRSAARLAGAAGPRPAGGVAGTGAAGAAVTGAANPATETDETGGGQGAPLASAPRGEWRRHPLMAPARLAARVVRKLKAWKRITLLFPLRPMGWAVALDQVVEPADIWHGMWAGSLPALVRQSKRLGGRTIYDSRDVYMLSRDFARLEWPFRPILAGAERRWARRVDRVLTVNEPYADLIAKQLGVERPPVVRNCPARWTPPVPAPDRIRAATGIGPDTSIALYQGQLTTERGIEQAMDAVLQVPNVVPALLGFGNMESQYRERASQAPYAGKVLLLPAVPPGELLEWSASADVMLIPIQPTTTNHQFTTPQKLWEAMAAGVPVVAADLRRAVSDLTRGNEIFLRMMTVNALAASPPLGRLRDFAIAPEAGGSIDLKKFGSRIFVDAARILALGAGMAATGTADRLRAVAGAGVVSAADAEAWVHAFHAVQGIRLAVQAAADGVPGNLVHPSRLNDFDRRVLLEGLRQARTMQQLLKSRYHIES